MNQPESNTHPDSAAGQGGPNAYVPPLERTAGQPPPIAANGGLSYMAFDQDGDAGTAAATRDAFQLVADGEAQALAERLANAPPGPIETEWGPGFRGYDECLSHIRASSIGVAEGELAVPLRYSVHERQTYSIVSSHAVWRDPAAPPRPRRSARAATTGRGASTFRSMVARQVSGGILCMNRSGEMAALLTRISTGPRSASTRPMPSSHAERSPTSHLYTGIRVSSAKALALSSLLA